MRDQDRAPTARAGPWRLEIYVSDDGDEPFATFVDKLDDFTYAALDAALLRVLARGGVDLARTEWLTPLGRGLHEFRVRHDAGEIQRMFGSQDADPVTNAISPPRPVLLRVFVHFHGERIALLLSGYNKGADPSKKRQEREISRARKHLRAWRERESRRRARMR